MQFSEWLKTHKHIIQISCPRSGRNWLKDLMVGITGRKIHEELSATPPYTQYLYIMWHMGENTIIPSHAKVIILVRDPRDVYLSLGYSLLIKNNQNNNVAYSMSSQYIDNAIHLEHIHNWRMYFEKFLKPDRLFVQYEYLCLEIEDMLQKIIDFIGCTPIRSISEIIKAADNTIINTIITPHYDNSIEYANGWDRYSNHCLKWQRDDFFTEEHNHTIWDKHKDIMSKYGYLKDGHDLNTFYKYGEVLGAI